MAQLTIYLDEATRAKAKRAAERANCSLSRWSREKLSVAADEGQSWPEGFSDLFGAIRDDSFGAIEALDPEPDDTREPL